MNLGFNFSYSDFNSIDLNKIDICEKTFIKIMVKNKAKNKKEKIGKLSFIINLILSIIFK